MSHGSTVFMEKTKTRFNPSKSDWLWQGRMVVDDFDRVVWCRERWQKRGSCIYILFDVSRLLFSFGWIPNETARTKTVEYRWFPGECYYTTTSSRYTSSSDIRLSVGKHRLLPPIQLVHVTRLFHLTLIHPFYFLTHGYHHQCGIPRFQTRSPGYED